MGDEVLCIGLLGVFSISAGDSVIADDAWRLRKAKTLIKLLALAPERRLHVDQAGELLWAGRDPDSVRGGSHSIPGFSTCDDGIVIDLSPMKGITVDVSGRTATAEGGVTWGELDAATQEHGLATTGGLISTTGVAGFTLGGGIGWLMRKYGLACDHLRSAQVVTADGQILTASATENPDLFWGLRGGGGNFGVVTSFELDLHPVGPTVAAGPVFYPGARAEEVMRFYRDFARGVPDELSTLVNLITAPPAPFLPEDWYGKKLIALVGCYCGDPEEWSVPTNVGH